MFLNVLTELLLLKSVLPEHGFHVNGATWYLSSMCIWLFILYPVLRRFGKTASAVVIPVLSLFAMGILYVQGPLNGNMMECLFGPVQKGFVRIFFGMGFGIAGYELFKNLSQIRLTVAGKILLSVAEWIIYIGFIVYTFLPNEDKMEYVLTLLLVVAICLTCSGQGITQKLFQNRICIFLGKMSLPIYLSHYFYSQGFKKLAFLADYSNADKLKVYFLVVFVTALIVMLCAFIHRKNKKRIAALIKKCCVATS